MNCRLASSEIIFRNLLASGYALSLSVKRGDFKFDFVPY